MTLAKLAAGEHEYITPDLIPRFDMYLSFTGGPTLRFIESRYGAPHGARALLLRRYRAVSARRRGRAGGTSAISGPTVTTASRSLESLMLEPARAVAGRPLRRSRARCIPEDIEWPKNVDREIHLSPREHPAFYAVAALHAERHARRDEAGGLFAERAPVRSRAPAPRPSSATGGKGSTASSRSGARCWCRRRRRRRCAICATSSDAQRLAMGARRARAGAARAHAGTARHPARELLERSQ